MMILVFAVAAFCIAGVYSDLILGNDPAAICRSMGTDTYCTWNYMTKTAPKKDPGYICGFESPSGSRKPHHVEMFDHFGNLLYVWAHKGKSLLFPEGTGIPLGDARMDSVSITVHYPYKIERVLPGETIMIMRQCTGEPTFIPFTNALHTERIIIPPGQSSFVAEASQPLTRGGVAKWFLVHAHNLGVRNHATLQGGSVARSTQMPQTFIPIKTPFNVQKGEIVHFACEYDSTKVDTTTVYGPTHTDEMCFVYLMVVDKNPNKK